MFTRTRALAHLVEEVRKRTEITVTYAQIEAILYTATISLENKEAFDVVVEQNSIISSN